MRKQARIASKMIAASIISWVTPAALSPVLEEMGALLSRAVNGYARLN